MIAEAQEELSKSQQSKKQDLKEPKAKGRITTDEQEEKIVVTTRTYFVYFRDYYGGLLFLVLSVLAMSGFLASKMSADYLVGSWAEQPDQQSRFAFYCGLSFAFVFAQGLFVFFRASCMQLFGFAATKKLHQDMIGRVLQAPVNLYFDTTPIGRILNKFSKDLNGVESGMSFILGGVYVFTFTLMYTVVAGVIALPYIALMLPVIFLISYVMIARSRQGIKESVRLVSTSKSPLLGHLSETIAGCPTLRAFDSTKEFIELNKGYLNQNILAVQFQSGVSAWFGIRVDLFALTIMIILTVVVVLCRDEDGSNAVILSMLMTSILNIQSTLMYLLKFWMMLESQMVNVVRCMRLNQVP